MTVDYDFVVDLSNVCRSEVLGAPSHGASLGGIRRLSGPLASFVGGRQPVLLYVADNSLWPLLEAADGPLAVNEWKLRNKHHLVEVGYADPAILDFAQSSGCGVVTMDKYEDWRSSHAWIQGCAERFFGWRTRPDGDLEVFCRTMSVLSGSQASSNEEHRAFKDLGYDVGEREHDAVIGRMYRCDNPVCELRAKNPWFLIGPPRRDRRSGQLVCDSCRLPVIDVGSVGPVSQLKFEVRGTGHAGRFTIYQGEGTKVGRQVLKANLEDATSRDFELLQQVSGEHVTFRAEPGGLAVADLGSTNGTWIQRYQHAGRTLSDPVKLERLQPTIIGPNDVLTLAHAVTIRRAGHRFRYDGLTTGEPEGASPRGGTRVAGSDG
jgi:hypothetical protein